MAVLMAEDKSRYNDFHMKWTIAGHNLSAYHSNSLTVHCFIYLQYHLELKWMVANHNKNQLSFKLKVLRCFRNLRNVSKSPRSLP